MCRIRRIHHTKTHHSFTRERTHCAFFLPHTSSTAILLLRRMCSIARVLFFFRFFCHVRVLETFQESAQTKLFYLLFVFVWRWLFCWFRKNLYRFFICMIFRLCILGLCFFFVCLLICCCCSFCSFQFEVGRQKFEGELVAVVAQLRCLFIHAAAVRLIVWLCIFF